MAAYAGPSSVCKECIWFGRPFRVWRWFSARAKFCTRQCYDAARRAFSDALANGQLEGILAEERERAKAARLKLMRETAWL